MGTILLLSGPNLNLFGQRDSLVYGSDTLDDMVGDARVAAEAAGHTLEHLQSNHEGDIVDAIHGARDRCVAIVINPGAFGHYCYAIADALATFSGIKVELHVSNPNAREEWRRLSVVAPVVTGTIAGFGRAGYRLAIEAALTKLGEQERTTA
ncbi:MAG TPA: type II 3-dehydroquinate dehydratase [Acidimicrobiia bacterium]|nr:type II 3-dehydroquinate dehydratase [Acidimicrobiia bacterium]